MVSGDNTVRQSIFCVAPRWPLASGRQRDGLAHALLARCDNGCKAIPGRPTGWRCGADTPQQTVDVVPPARVWQ
jgi:hypothetical protein